MGALAALVLIPVATASGPTPIATGATATPGTVPATGGVVKVEALVTGGSECSVTVQPAIARVQPPVACAGTDVPVSLDVTLPPNPSPAPIAYAITLHVTGDSSTGYSGSTDAQTTVSGAGVTRTISSTPVSFDFAPETMTCVRATVCVVGGAGGLGVLNPSTGSFTSGYVSTSGATLDYAASSCVHGAPVFCAAVTGSGTIERYSGGLWLSPVFVKGFSTRPVSSISCSRGLLNEWIVCALSSSEASDGSFAFQILTGTGLKPKGSTAVLNDPTVAAGPTFVACSSPSNCSLDTPSGSTGDWNVIGVGLRAKTDCCEAGAGYTNGRVVTGLSCSSQGVCAVGDDAGGVTMLLSAPQQLIAQWAGTHHYSVAPVSLLVPNGNCESFCGVTVDDHGELYQGGVLDLTTGESAWGDLGISTGGPSSLSCFDDGSTFGQCAVVTTSRIKRNGGSYSYGGHVSLIR